MKKTLWSDEEISIIKEKYKNNEKKDILLFLPNRTWKSIRYKANSMGINRNPEIVNREMVESSKKNSLDKYGVEHNWQREDIKKKIKETCLDRFGVEYAQKSKEVIEKRKQNNFEKYGITNTLHYPEFKNKSKETLEKNYKVSNPLQSTVVKERIKKTNQKNRGVDNVFQSEEIKKKIREKNKELYGVPNPQQNKEIREKTEQTCLNLFGHRVPSKNLSIQEKMKWGKDRRVRMSEVRSDLSCRKGPTFSEKIITKHFVENIDPKSKKKIHPILFQEFDLYSPRYDLWIQSDGDYVHGRNIKDKEDLKKDPNFYCKGSRVSGIYRDMVKDEIQNKEVPNLIRFWESDIMKAHKNGTLHDLVKQKFLEKGITLE